MRRIRFPSTILLGLSAPAAVLATSAHAADDAVRLAPHRAVYELSLDGSKGMRTIESARGRIAFEFTGNSCEGYALSFRQVTVLESAETGAKTSDLRTTNFESGDGKSFQFRNDSVMEGGPAKIVDGSAEHKPDGTVAVRLKTPKRDGLSFDGATVFPNVQMRDLIKAGRAGESTLSEKIYDGSEDGRRIYDTLAVIGKRIEPGGGVDKLEKPAQQDTLAKLPRWPVAVSYFINGKNDETPVYKLSFDLYENGVSRALRLDYGDFALKGEMSRLDMLPDKPCQR